MKRIKLVGKNVLSPFHLRLRDSAARYYLEFQNPVVLRKFRDRPIKPFKTEFSYTINIGNKSEWSPIRSVIIRVIDKIGRRRKGSPMC